MTNNLLFDFTVDKAAKKVFITREFDAELLLVWDAFTRAELIDQWIAPKPFTAKTKYQDFKVGGKRFYAMLFQFHDAHKKHWHLCQRFFHFQL